MSLSPIPVTPYQPPQNDDPLAKFGNVIQLQNAMRLAPLQAQAAQEDIKSKQLGNQQSEITLQNQQGMAKAMREMYSEDDATPASADGAKTATKGGPSDYVDFYSRLAKKMAKNGVTADHVQAVQQAGVDLAAKYGTANKDALANTAAMHNRIDDVLGAVEGLPADQQGDAWEAAKPSLLNLAKQIGDTDSLNAIQNAKYGGPDSIKLYRAINGAHTQMIEKAQKTALTEQAITETAAKRYDYQGGAFWDKLAEGGPKLVLPNGMSQDALKGTLYNTINNISTDKGLVNSAKQGVNQALSLGRVEDASKVVDDLRHKQNDIDTEKILAPFRKEQEKQIRLAMQGGLDSVQTTALGTVSKDSDAYSTLNQQLNMAKNNLQNAKNGNELAGALSPLETILGVTSSGKGARLNPTLINSAGGNIGSLARRLDATLEKAGTGNLPKATLAEMGTLLDQIGDEEYKAYQNRMASAIDRVKLPPETGGFYGRDNSLVTAGEILKKQKDTTRPSLDKIFKK